MTGSCDRGEISGLRQRGSHYGDSARRAVSILAITQMGICTGSVDSGGRIGWGGGATGSRDSYGGTSFARLALSGGSSDCVPAVYGGVRVLSRGWVAVEVDGTNRDFQVCIELHIFKKSKFDTDGATAFIVLSLGALGASLDCLNAFLVVRHDVVDVQGDVDFGCDLDFVEIESTSAI